MDISKNKLLDHFRLLDLAIRKTDVEAFLNVRNFAVALRRGHVKAILMPQFLASYGGTLRYVPRMTETSFMFAGWLPYYNKRWELATDKFAFKRNVAAAGLATPSFGMEPPLESQALLFKPFRSSFGRQLAGPFDASTMPPSSRGDGYFEEFVEGQALKIWYWNETPLCLEQVRAPRVVGDGRLSIEALMRRRLDAKDQLSKDDRDQAVADCASWLAFKGARLKDVPAAHRVLTVDYRYGSHLVRAADRQTFGVDDEAVRDLRADLDRIGRHLFRQIPDAIRQGTLYTVDAVLNERRIWLLEMNSNPTVHPIAYPLIVEHAVEQAASATVERRSLPSAYTHAV